MVFFCPTRRKSVPSLAIGARHRKEPTHISVLSHKYVTKAVWYILVQLSS